jgi:hypothetical protein
LVENRLNPISARASLELADDNLRCTVKEYSKWVEKALGISDLDPDNLFRLNHNIDPNG